MGIVLVPIITILGGACFLVLLIGTQVGIKMNRSGAITVAVLMMTAFAMLAYRFNSGPGSDLYVQKYWIDEMSNGGFQSFLGHVEADPLVVQWLYYYLFSLFKDANLIQPVTFLLFYGSVLLIIVQLSKRYQIPSQAVCWYLLAIFFVNGFSAVWGSIRMPLAWAGAILSITYEVFIRKSTKSFPSLQFWLTMVLCSLMHVAGVVPFLVYLASRYLNTFLTRVLLIAVPMVMGFFTDVTQSFGNKYVELLLTKIEAYQNENIYVLPAYRYYPEIAYLVMLTALEYFFARRALRQAGDERLKKYMVFYEFFLCLAWGSIGLNQVFNRWVWFLPLASLPMFWLLFEERGKGIQIVLLLGFLLACAMLLAYNTTVFMHAYTFVW